jgi:hypothetical protein
MTPETGAFVLQTLMLGVLVPLFAHARSRDVGLWFLMTLVWIVAPFAVWAYLGLLMTLDGAESELPEWLEYVPFVWNALPLLVVILTPTRRKLLR